jgi:hypothetical protein
MILANGMDKRSDLPTQWAFCGHRTCLNRVEYLEKCDIRVSTEMLSEPMVPHLPAAGAWSI